MQMYIDRLKKKRILFSNTLEGEKFDGVNIIDALSASGLRTIRFIK
jgi:tRNA G26 N,N-dimethylase Trm1